MERILIGVAWPYANGPLHLGHVAGSLLPPDIFARFHRMRGNEVLMVSGSDEHGTPITVTAEKDGVSPQEVVDRFHAQHTRTLEDLAISFDLFTRTSSDHHRDLVHEIFLGLQREGYIEERTMTAPFDPKAGRFLPDRYVEGVCPHCDYAEARGDQCDNCGKTLDAAELGEPRSKLNPDTPIAFKETKHFFFRLSDFEDRLKAYVSNKHHWRPNVKKFTEGWLQDGLKDRAVTRDITWGIPWPGAEAGYEDKRIYVWFEAVCGYYTASRRWAEDVAGDPDAWRPFWEAGHDEVPTRSYYFLAKDNIPFHTIIWPAILMGYSDAREADGQARLNLPYDVPGNEYLNLSGKQFSKSRGVGIWAHQVLEHFEPDAVRYYLAINMPETRDADWTWDDFLSKVNDELVAAYGNLVHRTLSLTHKHFGEVPPAGAATETETALLDKLAATHARVTEDLAAARFKAPLKEIMALAREGNRYIDAQAPWKLAKEDKERCEVVLHHALRLVRGLALLSAPYLPHASERLWAGLGLEGSVHEATWDDALTDLPAGAAIPEPTPLFTKLDPDEVARVTGAGAAPAPAPDVSEETNPMSETIPFDHFAKVQLKVGTVLEVADHPDADKLYVLKVDLGDGDVRQIVAGLKELVPAKELEGRQVVVVANLAPAKLRGVESQGMLLAADAGDVVTPLGPGKEVPAGTKVR